MALLAIVTDPGPVRPEELPETLLLDQARIAALKRDYTRILDSLAHVAVATDALTMARVAPADQGPLLELLCTPGAVGTARMPDIRPLLAAAGITGPGQDIIAYQIADSRRPNHTIRCVISNQLRITLLTSPLELVDGIPTGQQFLAAFDTLRVSNYALHGQLYHCLILNPKP